MPKAKPHEHHVYTDWKRVDGVLCVRCYRCGQLKPIEEADAKRREAMQKSHDERAATGTTYQQMR